jgi:hypothetical protein
MAGPPSRDLFAHRGLHQWGAGGEKARRFRHHHEVHERCGQRTVASRRTHHQAHQRHQTRQLGQGLQIIGATARGAFGNPVAGAFQHHHQRQTLLLGELAEPVALVGTCGADGAAEHGEVFGAGEYGASVDPPTAGDQCISRSLGAAVLIELSGKRTELDERARVEEQLDPLARSELAAVMLALNPHLAAHGRSDAATFAQMRQQRIPLGPGLLDHVHSCVSVIPARSGLAQ